MLSAKWALGLVAGAFMASAAQAGPLALDPTGLAGFTGSKAFQSGSLSATVDYAVFAPGVYPNGVGGDDPSNGAEYVYAYQIYVGGSVPVTAFVVGLPSAGAAQNAVSDPLHPDLGGNSPLLWNIGSSSAAAAFFGVDPNHTELLPGQHSAVLLFTSKFAPQFLPASVADGGQAKQESLPSPLVPEPGTALLGVLAAGYGMCRRVRRA